MKKMRLRPDFFIEQKAPQARLIQQNASHYISFDWILIISLSYYDSM